MDDFDGGFEDEFDHDDDDGVFDETFSESEMDDGTDETDVSLKSNDPYSGIKWQDWMLIGPISDSIAREKAEEERLIRENDKGSENEDKN